MKCLLQYWKSALAIIIIAIASISAVVLSIPSNDLGRLFVNDGKDLDLKIVNNVDHLTIYPDTFICEKWEITFPAHLYYFDGYYTSGGKYRWWKINLLLRPQFTERLNLTPSVGYLNSAPEHQFVERPWEECRHSGARDIHIIGRLVKLPERFGHRVWVRARQGENYITFAVDRRMTPQEAGVVVDGQFERDPLDTMVQRDIQRINFLLNRALVPVPALATSQYEKITAGFVAPRIYTGQQEPPVLAGRIGEHHD